MTIKARVARLEAKGGRNNKLGPIFIVRRVIDPAGAVAHSNGGSEPRHVVYVSPIDEKL
jgi:hypothetical protein